jgi:lysophospholipase L1-like esterase
MRWARIASGVFVVALLALVISGCSGGTSGSTAALPSSAVESTAADSVRSPSGTTADAVTVAIVGDSYTSGSAVGGNGAANWTAVARGLLDADGYPVELAVLGLSGSGYVRVGGTGKTFTDGVTEVVNDTTQLVVVFGSINDGSSAPAEVAKSAALALRRIDNAAPQAEIIIIGPQWIDGDPPANMLAIRDAVASAATIHPRVTFVDPLAEGWFGGASSSLIGSDGLHPTDAGHRHLAELIAPRIAGAIDTIRGAS